jgi:hypothetical protein
MSMTVTAGPSSLPPIFFGIAIMLCLWLVNRADLRRPDQRLH